jgi:hypothetical protein
MTNLLSLKVLNLNVSKRAFRSPVTGGGRPEYLWSADRKMIAECDKCNPGFLGTIGDECTCGLYSSPDLPAIAEYDDNVYAVLCLLNLYGTADLWWGPNEITLGGWDLSNTVICRSWGARIIGIVDRLDLPFWYPTQRGHSEKPKLVLASQIASDILNVDIFPWSIVEIMIKKTWEEKTNIKDVRLSITKKLIFKGE